MITYQSVDVIDELGEVPGRFGTPYPELKAPRHGFVFEILADGEPNALRFLRDNDSCF